MDKQNPSPSSTKVDRKTIEKNRRDQMNVLYSQLNSLLPRQSTREARSLPDKLGEAATYIKKLQARMERMKEKKSSLITDHEHGNNSGSGSASNIVKARVEIHESGGSALEVILTTGLNCQFIFNDTIRFLHEEGAHIVNACYFLVKEDTVVHTIHCEIEGYIPVTSWISQRLKKLVDDANMAC